MPLIIGSAVAVGSQLYQIGQSAHEKNQAKKALKELNSQPMPEFGIAPELGNAYARAEGNARFGFSGEEKAAFSQDLSRTQNTRLQAAKDVGGGQIAGVINAMDNSDSIGAINQLAAQGARLKQEKIQYADQIAGRLQDIKRMNDEVRIQRRLQLENAYGNAIRQQQTNINNAIGGLGALGMQAAFIGWTGTPLYSGSRNQSNQVEGSNIIGEDPLNPSKYSNDISNWGL
jgi:hypothetical protein